MGHSNVYWIGHNTHRKEITGADTALSNAIAKDST
jgi:hypothetical protein